MPINANNPVSPSLPPSINLHLLKECNARCRFCFATFRNVQGRLAFEQVCELISRLREAGGEKLTFAGGEPTLHPDIGPILEHAKSLGFVTCMVTNGARLEQLLDSHAGVLDWVGLSVDSASDEVEEALGRGRSGYVAKAFRLAARCHEVGVRVKLNTVVTSLNADEDMSPLVELIAPERWKVLQVLPVEGQNDDSVESLLITSEEFQAFVDRHISISTTGISLVPESNDAMTGSYAMVDPLGRFFDNTSGTHRYSEPIVDSGVSVAWAQVSFSADLFENRGGLYQW